ncbi:hypothetical protein P43SY_009454 [Pythium insidiosum]|uniref:Transmembrane protein n=1 Tax=Pythium insidiosum TaxID=114742 RepID=A0AAD5LMN3_PYTIN|nr:hypothetical protein P43SY_009454 [Pythium insidiosum]
MRRRWQELLAVCAGCSCVHLVDASPVTTVTGTPLVFGLGPGLVAILVLAVACLVICVCGYSSRYKTLFAIALAVIIGATTLFFATVNVKGAPSPATKAERYNHTAVARSAVAGVMIAFTVVALFALLLLDVIKHRQGHFIGEAAAPKRWQRAF